MSGISRHAVVVAGAGPTGLMLAGELALAGVDVTLVERRASQELVGWRARTTEVFDQRGIAERFIAQARIGQFTGFGTIQFDVSDFPSRHNYTVGLPQRHIERILAEWVDELKVPILRGLEVTGFAQDEAGVDVELSDGRSLRTDYLVGCDGGRSLIRKLAGIDFAGWDPTMSALIAEVEMDEEPEWSTRRTSTGYYGFSRPDENGPIRAQAAEKNVGRTEEPTLDDLREAIVDCYGTDFGLRSAVYISRFSDMTRQAASYRDRRVLLAGDATHVHSPIGGQGLSLGAQDAVNLGWKLAQVVKGTSPDSLLDTYQAERYPVAARVLHNTMAQVALSGLSGLNERTEALQDIVGDLLRMDEPRKHIAGMMTMLDVHYDFAGGDDADVHPLVGRRMPDLDLVTADGPLRVFTLLHDARPVLLNLGEPGDFDHVAAPWADRVKVIDAEHTGTWELPVLGTVTAASAVLIRPDGHVAWVADPDRPGLADALARWFGPPTAAE